MRPSQFIALICLISIVLGARADDKTAPKDIIEKALKAHGGKENLARLRTARSSSTGTIEYFNGVEFKMESTYSLPKRLRQQFIMTLGDEKIEVLTVFNDPSAWTGATYYRKIGKDAWEKKDEDKVAELKGEDLAALKEAMHLVRLSLLDFLSDKDCTLTAISGDKVDGKDVVGVKVACKGFADVALYFNRETGLLAKMQSRKLDPKSKQNVVEDRIVVDYLEIDDAKPLGLSWFFSEPSKVPHNVVVTRAGKKYLTSETTDIKALDKVNESVFAKP